MPARDATVDELSLQHGREYIEVVKEVSARGGGWFDADTYLNEHTYAAAVRAAGGVLSAVEAVLAGRDRTALCLVRPPGHHALPERGMGFCLFNNVAIAAHALRRDGVERILILDWDVHHGNGTQHLFEADRDVLYFSSHQFPFYPGTGDFVEAGHGAGTGATVNVPLPPGCGDAEYVGLVRRILVPVALAFRPELILVSCGFDAHRDDVVAPGADRERACGRAVCVRYHFGPDERHRAIQLYDPAHRAGDIIAVHQRAGELPTERAAAGLEHDARVPLARARPEKFSASPGQK